MRINLDWRTASCRAPDRLRGPTPPSPGQPGRWRGPSTESTWGHVPACTPRAAGRRCPTRSWRAGSNVPPDERPPGLATHWLVDARGEHLHDSAEQRRPLPLVPSWMGWGECRFRSPSKQSEPTAPLERPSSIALCSVPTTDGEGRDVPTEQILAVGVDFAFWGCVVRQDLRHFLEHLDEACLIEQ